MSLEAELLALAGEESDEDVKAPSSPPPRWQSPTVSSPKKRSRAPVKRSRKKARRGDDSDNQDDGDEESDTADERSFDASSQSEPDVPMDLGSDSDSDDEDSGQDLYPLDGKYKDHADKENLLSMTEIDREAVLAERMAQIERAQQDRHLRNLLKSRNAADKAAAASAFTRKSMRTKSAPKKNEEATKRGKLDELRRNREERKATVGRRSPFGEEDASRKILSEGEEEERFTEEYEIVKDEREISLADVNRCRIGRTGLAKLCDYPGFDEVIQDVFVRATLWDKESAQNVYRMATAKGFTTGKMYTMLDGTRRTDQHLLILHGKSEKPFPMDMLSDKPFTESEFNRFKKTLEVDKISLPTLSQVQSKIKALRELDARVLTTEEISVMIAKRNKGKGDVLSFINDRRRLREARETALMNDDEVAIARIDQELQDLEDRNKAGTNARVETQMQRMARLNAENRKRNMAEIRQAEIAEKRAARLALQEAEQGGGSFANPFMRVKTAVKFRHDIHGDELAVKKDSANGSPKSTTTTITATTTDVVDNTKAVGNTKENRGVGVMNGAGLPKGRKRGGVDDVIASMDLGIEIDI